MGLPLHHPLSETNPALVNLDFPPLPQPSDILPDAAMWCWKACGGDLPDRAMCTCQRCCSNDGKPIQRNDALVDMDWLKPEPAPDPPALDEVHQLVCPFADCGWVTHPDTEHIVANRMAVHLLSEHADAFTW